MINRLTFRGLIRKFTKSLAWPPCVAEADMLFTAVVTIFLLLSSPILSGRILDVYHIFTHDLVLVRI